MLPELTALAERIEADAIDRHRTSDAVVARGALTSARRWPAALARLAAGVPEGGRLIVDARSHDHLAAVLADRGEPDRHQRRQLRRLRGLVAPETLVAAADAAGLAVVAVVPYGLLLGGPGPGLSHLASLESTHRWRRTLSWLPEDPELTELVLLLERSLVAALPTVVAHRLVVVLEKRPDPAGNADWLRRQADASSAWRTGSTDLGVILSGDVDALDRLLRPAHGRYLGFALLDAVQDRLRWLDARSVLRESRAEQYDEWRRAHAVDEATTHFMRDWSRGCRPRFRRGVDTTLAVDYPLVADVLERHLKLFGEMH